MLSEIPEMFGPTFRSQDGFFEGGSRPLEQLCGTCLAADVLQLCMEAIEW